MQSILHFAIEKYQDKIGIKEKLNLFNAQHLYIDNVVLSEKEIEVNLENVYNEEGVRLICDFTSGSLNAKGENIIDGQTSKYTFDLSQLTETIVNNQGYSVLLYFNESFVYLGNYVYQIDAPF